MENIDTFLEDLSKIYYNPSTGFRSSDELYRRSRQAGIPLTKKQVKQWYESQATAQQFKSRRKGKSYPLISSVFGRIQIDLLDVSNEAPNLNKGFHFIFVAIDVFTRYAFAVGIKNKSDSEVFKAFKQIINEIREIDGFYPYRLDSDKESSFMSRQFKKFCNDHEITQVFPDSKYTLGLVEHFNRMLRQYIERYKTYNNTRVWHSALSSFIDNYNSSWNQNLNGSPVDAVNSETSIDNYITEQTKKADKILYNKQSPNIGDKVRVKLLRTKFEKGTRPVWSKTIHNVLKITNDGIFVSDRVKPYNAFNLQVIDDVQNDEPPVITNVRNIREDESDEKVERRVNRILNVDGIDNSNIRTSRRERAPANWFFSD